MNSKDKIQNAIATAVILVGFAFTFGLSGFIERNRPPLPAGYEDENSGFEGANVKGYTLGFDGLIADWYWMKSLQYVGEKLESSKDEEINIENLRSLNLRLLYPYLDNATSLDPQFMAVYSYGSIVLPAVDSNQAIKITEKGIANNPTEWRLYHHLGYIYWRLGNFRKASEVYTEGAKITGAPVFMKMMAAQMLNAGGSRETSRKIYEQMFDDHPDPQTKETAALRLLELDSLDQRDAINEVLRTFQQNNGRCPENWREVLTELRKIRLPQLGSLTISAEGAPVDPSNAEYIFNKQANKCEAEINHKQSKIPPKL